MLPPFFVYRSGWGGIDPSHRFFMYSETWVSTDPEVSDTDSFVAMINVSGRYHNVFHAAPVGWFPQGIGWVVERLYPHPKKLSDFQNLQLTTSLNPNAPEAAVRLQRVGASGSLGRLAIPISNDAVFTDLPHRRHVDATLLNSMLVMGISSFPLTWVQSGRTYTNAIVDRRAGTFDPVVSYRVLESTIRIWQRIKKTPPGPVNAARNKRCPPEMTWSWK